MNPCSSCGACCASFRVSFYWREADASSTKNAVPAALVENVNQNYSCMRGTNTATKPRCVALEGEVGKRTSCAIYPSRSTTCREFKASFEDGSRDERCDEARARHGLRPLTVGDWKR